MEQAITMDEKFLDLEPEQKDRALNAYFRRQGKENIVDQPTAPEGRVINGKEYIVLYNVRGILSVYRIKPDGSLKGLKKYPKQLMDEFE